MAIECPHCRMVTGNDRASHCIACDRKFFGRERKFRGLTSWWAFLIPALFVLIMGVLFLRHC